MTNPKPRPSKPECIRLRGVRQNNLKGFDLDVPLAQYVVVTGLSGAGKSSLVFETLHAEGQRRYVETFSAYTRQFLELLNKPRVDSIENIRPSIAIEQTNTIRTTRSTVGTMTELTDYFKVWFSQVAECYDPATGEKVEDDTPLTIWTKALAANPGETVLLGFKVAKPDKISWEEILQNLRKQSYARILVPGGGDTLRLHRIEGSADDARELPRLLGPAPAIFVVQDRIGLTPESRSRFTEATEQAMHFGNGEVRIFTGSEAAGGDAPAVFRQVGHYSRGLHSPRTGRTFRPATPGLFSFNSPLGACPRCRGFGRIIEIDYRLALPDRSLSIEAGAIRCWEGEVYGESKDDLKKFARRRGIPTTVPFSSLTAEQQAFVIDGEPGYGEGQNTWPKAWYGVKGFFRYLEKTTYKMHVRVFLSRYRAYNICPDCHGARLQPEALCWRWRGRTLPDLYQLPVSELADLIGSHAGAALAPPNGDGAGGASADPTDLAREAILSRLRYLREVGVDYLTLDRTSKTLSGGEVQRVNLTGCLGTSLVDTLFVLDEPSVGLHPRDVDRLIAVIRMLTDAGNTVVVVEHDESMIRAADHVIEIGPEPGHAGGHVVFQGSVGELLQARDSITGKYLSGRESIPVPAARREGGTPPAGASGGVVSSGWLEFTKATKHNIRAGNFRLPIGRFVCLSGVSGSGKSTLLDNVIFQGLQTRRQLLAEDPATIEAISGDGAFSEVVMVDQSPLSRTPRSNAALYVDAWEPIRELFAGTPAAQAAGFTASSFSFNSGDGRCDHCKGLGFERVEMQFLSDVFVPCPICEGKRFKPEVLAIQWNGRSVADTLDLSVNAAIAFFAPAPVVAARLAGLAAVGLGYLTLGQPLNTLSGGEAQRLKLVGYLGEFTPAGGLRPATGGAKAGALLLLDEPTTGLHRHDVRRLLEVLHALVDRGHTVVAIEHNLDVLKSADWLIEIGPGAGDRGGQVVAEGTPEDVARADTATSPYLRAALRSPGSRRGSEGEGESEGERALVMAAEAAGSYSPSPAPPQRYLCVTGAREHNLKGISCRIPHHELTVITGVSGSGKSTLAFDIIFAEGQRRFMESMSPYARQFVEQLPRPAVDRLTGIPPTVAIEQRVTRGSRKSTVATITEVAQYLRLLYAKIGVQHHPESDRVVEPLRFAELERMFHRVVRSRIARRSTHLYLCAPVIRGRKGHHQPIATWAARQGYQLLRVDGGLVPIAGFQKLDRYKEHSIEVVVADLKSADPSRAAGTGILRTALRLGHGACFLADARGAILSWFSDTRTDVETGESFPALDPKSFSFNSPAGWCPTCRGHGRIFSWMVEEADEDEEDNVAARLREYGVESAEDVADAGEPCPECHGARLNRTSRAVKLHFRRRRPPQSLPDLLRSTPDELLGKLRQLELDARGRAIVQDIVPQIAERLAFLGQVGLTYLSLDRPTETLSGGEAQRIRLAAQLGSNLSGALYVLDEPSIGLHARDNRQLIATLEALRDKGNTLVVVEHDEELMERADTLIDLGPGAGVHGGEILASGTPQEIKRSARSLTGLFLQRGIPHPLRGRYREEKPAGWLELRGARMRNLDGFDLRLPLGRLIMVAGPSGAGKSTLFRDLLGPAIAFAIEQRRDRLRGSEFPVLDDGLAETRSAAPGSRTRPPFKRLSGAAGFKAVIEVDQAPIGRTPRSTPATYLGVFDLIRQFFASLPEAKIRGYTASRFSFNVPGGRCRTCEGAGRIKFEMAFMPETYLPCEDCGGLRYSPEMAEIAWKGRSIGEVLRLTFEEAAEFFDFHSQLGQVCRLMVDCGLGYLTLGQSSPTLSGGEAQRLKLVTELARGLASYRERSRGELPRNFYILEEPTIGLHLSDCEKLIRVLHSLVDQGHTVVVIEHHLDLLAEADYIVELGPDGGPGGGELIYQGDLRGLLKVRRSPTAPFLKEKLNRG